MTGPHQFSRTNGEPLLTVVVADDNAMILEKASTLLSKSFNVVAAVTDGKQALEASLRLDPDVAVLDITMPQLDGLQTTRELRRAGSRAKIVIMTMHNSDVHVAAALESGAQGYVLKTQLHSDLASAIDHAVAGRHFVPSLTSLLAIGKPGTGSHALQYRVDDHGSLDELSRLVSAALQRGEMTAILATEATRAGIARRLIASGWDLAVEAERGKYVEQDAALALSQVLVEGRIDPDRLAAAVDGLERSRVAASAPRLTLIGEMAGLLLSEGNFEAAIQLEQTWDSLTRTLPFLTVCSYPVDCFSEEENTDLAPQICAVHRYVSHAHDA